MTISNHRVEFTTHSAAQTQRLGIKLAKKLVAGDVVALFGDLGSGKTTLVRGLVRGLGAGKSTRVTSPTFVLLNIYKGRLPVYHFDFYRLADAGSIYEIGCSEYFAAGGISVVEWADRARELLPPETIKIELATVDETTREIIVSYPCVGNSERSI